MESTRLPGKMLLPLGPLPVIAHVVIRCKLAGWPVYVAIPDTRANDRLGAMAAEHGAEVWRGHPTDCLSRLTGVARYTECTYLVRITGDCPLINPVLMEHVVVATIRRQAGYGSNTTQRTFPRGLDVQVYARDYLEHLHRTAVTEGDREHVRPRAVRGYARLSHTQRLHQQRHRWVLDTPEDYRWLCCVAAMVGMTPPHPTTSALLAAIREDPALGWYEPAGPAAVDTGDGDQATMANST